MNESKGGWMDMRIYKLMDGWMNARMHRRMNARMHRRMNGWVDE